MLRDVVRPYENLGTQNEEMKALLKQKKRKHAQMTAVVETGEASAE